MQGERGWGGGEMIEINTSFIVLVWLLIPRQHAKGLKKLIICSCFKILKNDRH